MDNKAISDKTRNNISTGFRNGKRPEGDSNAKTCEALDILGGGKPYGSELGPKGRPAHDKALYAEDTLE